ncbi:MULTISPECIES: hypothetical protein [Photorhabdus]|uniref:Uncharacterized protein n=1 Tax=Photorhabdus luminescens TaxID=29488 RepID=A0A1G5QVQ6_PHOLU|nr:hypothetical protein [Photorhabdus luminescens]SCZ65179.1 hypothetical protein SAMN02982990_02370 [Photorhabdus luminescens]
MFSYIKVGIITQVVINIYYHCRDNLFLTTQQPPTKVGVLVINGLKVRIRIG